jgi:hypothetical protein
MNKEGNLIQASNIKEMIYFIRGHRVMLDSDLAFLYGVTTKRLNEQVRRNLKRFPKDFMFQLSWEEIKILRSQNATSNQKRGGRRSLPFAFTEHGSIMLASVLNSDRAIQASIYVVKAFVSFKNFLINYDELKSKFNAIEKRITGHDKQIRALFDAIRRLMTPAEKQKRKIGF